MKNNIQTIIDEFDKEFYPLDDTDILVDNFKNGKFWGRKKTLEEAKQFLKDSLTSMLDGIEKETLDHMEKINNYAKENREDYETVNEAHSAYSQLKEVINIINSHR